MNTCKQIVHQPVWYSVDDPKQRDDDASNLWLAEECHPSVRWVGMPRQVGRDPNATNQPARPTWRDHPGATHLARPPATHPELLSAVAGF